MEIKRVFDLLDWMVENYPREDALAGKRKGVWERYSTSDYYKYSHLLAYGLYEVGIKKGDKILTISNSRPEWNFLDMAIGMLGAVHIPIYPTLSVDNYVYIFNHCDADYIVIGNAVLYRRVLPALENLEKKLKVYTIDEVPGEKNISEILDLGIAQKEKNEPIVEEIKRSIKPDDLFTIVYTSGTTGDSKGVMLSHYNLVFNFIATAHCQLLDYRYKVLSFLPLNHIFERCLNYHYQYLGIGLYYAENIGSIMNNMAEIHGDGFCTVPRVLETFLSKIASAGRDLPYFSRKIYYWAIKHGYKFDWEKRSLWFNLLQRFYDKTVYSKWRAKFGGHHLVIICGGSAIQTKIVRLFTAAGMEIYEGYGMTESSPVIAVNNPNQNIVKLGTVGPVLEGTELKFSDEGEILTRGPHVMQGYYKDPEYTKQVIDSEGWLHTGDIGELVDGKFLKITDRKKEIFKLSAGKYVAPQLIENMLKASSYIEQVMVIGENEKFASAIVVPDIQHLRNWAEKNRIEYCDNYDLIQLESVYKHYQRIIEDFNNKLAPHEQIKRFRLVSDEWTMQNGMLSPTLKLKRSVLLKYYKELIDEIYNKTEQVQSRVLSQDISNITLTGLHKAGSKLTSVMNSAKEMQKAHKEVSRREREAKRLANEAQTESNNRIGKAARMEKRRSKRTARESFRLQKKIAKAEWKKTTEPRASYKLKKHQIRMEKRTAIRKARSVFKAKKKAWKATSKSINNF